LDSDLRERLEHALSASELLERELSGGGMSRVFVAEERALGRQVVINVLPSELAATVSTAGPTSTSAVCMPFGFGTTLRRPASAARALLKEVESDRRTGDVANDMTAMAYAGMGDRDAAFRWLDTGMIERSGVMPKVRRRAMYQSLHSDPRWANMLARMAWR
jgi:hypothetical protein